MTNGASILGQTSTAASENAAGIARPASDPVIMSSKSPFWHIRSCRLLLALIFMAAITSNGMVRNSLSMAMVCMINGTALSVSGSNVSSAQNAPSCTPLGSHLSEYDGTILWSSQEQGFLFSAMFLGGVISGIPAGYLADRYNTKIIVSVCLAINIIGCMLTPITALSGGLLPVFVLRLLVGLGGQATIYPPITVITAHWIPPTERSIVIALYTAGNQVANIIGGPLNSFLCTQKDFFGGWPAIFYVTGIICVPSIVLWLLTVTNSPEDSKLITEKEKKYILYSLQKQNLNKKKVPFKEVPWRKMLTSMVVLAAVINNFTYTAMNAILTSYIPLYFKQSLLLDLSSNGALSALPFISQLAGKILFSSIADQIKSKTNFSHTWICRIFNSIGTFGAAAFLLACAYMDCTQVALAVTFVTIANGLFSCQVPGFLTSLLCIAPMYTGMVSALSMFVGHVGAVVSPYVVGAITVDGTSAEWRLVFIVIAVGMVISGLLFLIFGSAEIQPWATLNRPNPDQESKGVSVLPQEFDQPSSSHDSCTASTITYGSEQYELSEVER